MNNALDSSVLSMILSSGIAAQLILTVLVVCSIACWAIIFYKIAVFRKAEQENGRFLSAAFSTGTLRDVKTAVISMNEGSAWSLSRTLLETLDPHIDWDHGVLRSKGECPSLSMLERVLRSRIQNEIGHYEKAIHFLATVGNTAPFVGLFGTVWGIMNSFRAIGLQESANIAVVAPGVAEALISTAAGLAAAIPAVVAYNFFINQLGRLEAQLESFSSELIALIEEVYHRSSPLKKESE